MPTLAFRSPMDMSPVRRWTLTFSPFATETSYTSCCSSKKSLTRSGVLDLRLIAKQRFSAVHSELQEAAHVHVTVSASTA